MLSRRHLIGAAALPLAALPFAALPRPAAAQGTFPNRPVRIVVMFPAGGVADGLARPLAERLAASLGQPVVVDNRPGGNGVIAAQFVARSAPDGHTLFLASDAALSINPLVYSNLPYDPAKDFVPVSVIASTVETLLVPASLPVRSVAELVRYAKERPGQLSFGSFGVGSSAHLGAEAFRVAAGIDILHVPYRGVVETVPALLSNQIQILVTSQGQALPHIGAGTIRCLAVMSDAPQPTLPGVPTMAEAGYPEVRGRAWFGLVAPAGTPTPVVERLAEETRRIVAMPDYRERAITNLGLIPHGGTPAEFAAVLADDRAKYGRLISAINLRLD